MNTNPTLQSKLYGLDKTFFEIINLINLQKLPTKVLLSGPKGSGKSTMAYHIVNYIFSKNETHPYNLELNEINADNKSFKLIKNGSHPNFYLIDLIDDKKNIAIWHISDTHNKTRYIKKLLINVIKKFGSKNNIIIHSGDATDKGKIKEFIELNEVFGEIKKNIPNLIILFVPGNHDLYNGLDFNIITKLVKNAIVLVNKMIILYNLKIYGSPWYYKHWWNYHFRDNSPGGPEYDCFKIPKDVDILITHGPPFGILDKTDGIKNYHTGSIALRKSVNKIKPYIHCFGHIHEENTRNKVGQKDHKGKIHNSGGIFKNNSTCFVNSAMKGRWDKKILNDFHVITNLSRKNNKLQFNVSPINIIKYIN